MEEPTESVVANGVVKYVTFRDPDDLRPIYKTTSSAVVDSLVKSLDAAIATKGNVDDVAVLRQELDSTLDQKLRDAIVTAYTKNRLLIRAENSRLDLDMPRLVAVQSSTASVEEIQEGRLLQSSAVGSRTRRRRRQQLATIDLQFDDDSHLNVVCDLNMLEQMHAAVTDAQAEAVRALGSLKQE